MNEAMILSFFFPFSLITDLQQPGLAFADDNRMLNIYGTALKSV